MSTNVLAPPPRVISSVPVKPQKNFQRGLLLRANFKSATKALMANGTRSFLTMLGIIIGVASVITAVTQAEGTSANINQNFASLGSNIVTIQSGAPPQTSSKGGFMMRMGGGGGEGKDTLTQNDITALATLPHVVQVGPIIQPSGGLQTIYQGRTGQFQIQGVASNYQSIHSLQVAQGTWFSAFDEEMAVPNIVIGSVVAETLFVPLKVDPIGQMVRIGSQMFRVVGVLASADMTVDQSIYAPFKSVQARLTNSTTVGQIEVQVDEISNIPLVQEQITSLLRQRHNITEGKEDDFWLQSPSQLIQNRQASASSLGALLIGIAAISLTVGGIGIMNIMLVSVTERTREIGVRMAVGARKGDIRNQFLIEAILLSAIGGLIGVLLGLFVGYQVNIGSNLPFVLNPGAILLAVAVSGSTGILFGLYPAIRASDLDPIVALRSQ